MSALTDPTFWLTWPDLTWPAVMTAILLCAIVCGVLARTALALVLVQLHKVLAREGR